MDYLNFSAKDFLADDYFLRWVGQSDPEADKFWNLFISLHPEMKPRIAEARALALNLKAAEYIAVDESKVDQVWNGIQDRITEKVPVRAIKTPYPLWRFGLAASFILLSLFIAIYLSRNKIATSENAITYYSSPATHDFVEEVNTTQNSIRIHLSDGSVVALGKNSRLKYKTSYKGEESRHVFLIGEAFFDVSKNPKQPFFVHANEVVTKVLGTSFRIIAYGDDKNITVAVRTGKVSVFSPTKSLKPSADVQSEVNGVILLPNQQVVYQREKALFDKTLVDIPAILSQHKTESDFIFENAPIADVFNTLQEAYGIEIIFDEDVMKSCFLTAPLGSENLFEKLKIICRTIGASYEIMDSKVVINSTGC